MPNKYRIKMVDVKNLFLSALMIVVAASVAVFMTNTPLTGLVGKEKMTTISVSPTYVDQNNREIRVTIVPGSNGADREVDIHKFNGDPNSIEKKVAPGVKVYTTKYCGESSVCREENTVKFVMGSNDYDQYYATVRDCNNVKNPESYCKMDGSSVKAFFTVEKSKQLREREQNLNPNPIPLNL